MTWNNSFVKTRATSFATAAVLVLATTCAAQTPHQSPRLTDKDRVSEERNIQEAVFRYLFVRDASGHQDTPVVFCLSVAGGDPSDELMRRFGGNKPPVRKASQCNADAVKGVTEKSTGKRGLIFKADTIKWTSESAVEVSGGYYEDGLSASGNTYQLVKRGGTWKVIKDRMNWIS